MTPPRRPQDNRNPLWQDRLGAPPPPRAFGPSSEPPQPAKAEPDSAPPATSAPREVPRTRPGAARLDAVPRTETVRVTAPDLRRRAAEARSRRRLGFSTAVFALLFAAVVGRLSWVTVIRPQLPPKAPHPVAALLEHPATLAAAPLVRRAMITDRHGQILAISLPAASLYADPREIIDPAKVAAQLKTALPELDLAMATRRLAETDKQFVYLAFRVTPLQEEQIIGLGIPGVEFLPTEIRRYPMGHLAAQVLGGINVDDHGIAGVEKAFDHRLMTDPKPLALSIDVRVQAVLTEELQQAMTEFQAIGATGIVMKVDTG